MGEIAEMMLDGTMCEACGVFIDEGEADGYPRYCSDECAQSRGMTKSKQLQDFLLTDAEVKETCRGILDAFAEEFKFTIDKHTRALATSHLKGFFSQLYLTADRQLHHYGFDKIITNNQHQNKHRRKNGSR